MQILTNTRHPDDAWRALAQLQHAAREALSVAPEQAKASHASRAEPTEDGTGMCSTRFEAWLHVASSASPECPAIDAPSSYFSHYCCASHDIDI